MNATLQLLRKYIVIFSLILLLTPFISLNTHSLASDQYVLKDGDILLQHIPSYLSSVIADVSNSQYSHCGIVVHREGRPYVIEAIGPVLYTPASDWISRGASGQFTQLRPKNITLEQIKRVLKESAELLGKPYDIQYELDEEKIYCSELVYKAFLRGSGIEIGTKQTLGSLDWEPHEKFIRHIAHGKLPLERVLVTPESLTISPNINLIYTSFPQPKKISTFNTAILQGEWSGEYTINGLNKAHAVLVIGESGNFISGHIKHNKDQIDIESFSVYPFKNKSKFSATLTDTRGVKARINAQITDYGEKIIGDWNDNFEYTGIFSLSKRK